MLKQDVSFLVLGPGCGLRTPIHVIKGKRTGVNDSPQPCSVVKDRALFDEIRKDETSNAIVTWSVCLVHFKSFGSQ